jgi:hypothetical protein
MNLLPLATLLVDPQTALIAGTILPLIMTRLIRQQPEVEFSRAVNIGAAWGVMYGLSVGYMYFNYADWMFAYLVDTTKFPLLPFYFVFLASLAFSGAAGAALTASLIRQDRTVLAYLTVLGAVLTLAVVWVPHWDSYSHMGTLAEWKAGTAPLMPGPPSAAMGMNVAGAIAAIFSVAVIVHTVRRSLKT